MTFTPNLGRWLQEDPIGLEGDDTNLYRAEGDNPVNAADPSGLTPYYDVGLLLQLGALATGQPGAENSRRLLGQNPLERPPGSAPLLPGVPGVTEGVQFFANQNLATRENRVGIYSDISQSYFGMRLSQQAELGFVQPIQRNPVSAPYYNIVSSMQNQNGTLGARFSVEGVGQRVENATVSFANQYFNLGLGVVDERTPYCTSQVDLSQFGLPGTVTSGVAFPNGNARNTANLAAYSLETPRIPLPWFGPTNFQIGAGAWEQGGHYTPFVRFGLQIGENFNLQTQYIHGGNFNNPALGTVNNGVLPGDFGPGSTFVVNGGLVY